MRIVRRACSGSIVRGLPSCGRSPVAPRAGRRSGGASPNRSRRGRPVARPACRPWAAWRRRPSHVDAGHDVVVGWASASAVGLYLGVPETDHVVGIAAVLAAVRPRLARRARASELGAGRRPRRRAGLGGRPRGAGRRTGAARRARHARPPARRPVDVASALARGARSCPARCSLPRWSVCRPPSPSPSPARRHVADTIAVASTVVAVGLVVRRGGGPRRRRTSLVVKRALDVVVAATLLVVTAPLLAAVAVAIGSSTVDR